MHRRGRSVDARHQPLCHNVRQRCRLVSTPRSALRTSHFPRSFSMDRRQFITATTATLGAAVAAAKQRELLAQEVADQKTKRVGLIGCGWYGKCDLFRLIQVSPVEVVSLCDVDKKQLEK